MFSKVLTVAALTILSATGYANGANVSHANCTSGATVRLVSSADEDFESFNDEGSAQEEPNRDDAFRANEDTENNNE